MPLNKRDTKFALRVCVLLLTTFSMALAVRVVFESQEFTKLLPPSTTRTILLFLAPAASLAILQYTLAVKSFNTRSLPVEGLIFLAFVCIFGSVVSPAIFGELVEVPVDDCGRWLRACPDDAIWVADKQLVYGLRIAGFLLLAAVLTSQLSFRNAAGEQATGDQETQA